MPSSLPSAFYSPAPPPPSSAIIPPVPRNSIERLSPALVNRIAAGEVIERPASVVKELVENSLDAGATQITVEVEQGGTELIRIIDDGHGIPAPELPLAFASHATSKLRDDEDLFRIATMGFRGEALASIGSVSQSRILSRTSDQETAFEIQNHGGIIDQAQAAAGNIGTVIEVRHLFFNTPARRKFLRGAPTEFGHISDALLRLAIPFPEIAFKLIHNGRTALDLPATTAKNRWLAAWPDEFSELTLPIDVRDAEISLVGLIGKPELARPTAKHQFFFINRRCIRDRFIQHAVREAYRGLTEPGRQPAAIFFLAIPPQDLDVNVHPTKSEVRFRDSGRIHGLILSAVRERLLGSDLSPAAALQRTQDDPERLELRQRLAAFFQSPPSSAPGAPVESAPVSLPAISQSAISRSPISQTIKPLEPSATPALQLHNSYLVAETEDGLIIIDQHALHERVMYEDLLARVNRGPLESQRLLIPATFAASARQIEILDQAQSLLNRLGIEAAAAGPAAIAVHSFPSFLQRLDPVDFLHELLERGEQEQLDLHQEEMLHEVLDMMACKAAIKAGDPLSSAEIEALLARRHLLERASNCPHGRPTTLRLTLRDLEKQFKRTGF
jgi:DNA mismatch repair protein MutL